MTYRSIEDGCPLLQKRQIQFTLNPKRLNIRMLILHKEDKGLKVSILGGDFSSTLVGLLLK